jgi:hypothetical protein
VSEPPSSEDLDPYPATTRPTPPQHRYEEGELKQLLLKLQKQTLGHKIVLKIPHVYAE